MSTLNTLRYILSQRIMLLDGAMGTMIQHRNLDENDFRGEYFTNHSSPLNGNNDLLSITRPDIIQSIHEVYFSVGADFATTNSFNATSIAQADYSMESYVYDINYEAAQCARLVADNWSEKTPDKPRFVIGVLGPTNRTASLSPDINDPAKRLVTFDQLRQAYFQSANALLEGGADILMIETVFDTLNAKAALYAIAEIREKIGNIPIMVSGTITDASGRTLSGQNIEAFWVSMMHGNLLSIGLNCALGANEMLPYIKRLDVSASCFISAHPNAGLPNEFGKYDETPEQMASQMELFLKGGHVNILGGCCGTTPKHIAKLHQLASQYTPRLTTCVVY